MLYIKQLTLSLNMQTTPPWTVLSPAEKGGRLGVGLATLPRKKKTCCYRNTNDESTNSTSSGRRRAFLAKVHEELQGKPKGTCNTDYPSDDQKNLKHRQALNWNPQGQRKRGRPRNTWRRELEKDIKRTGHTWKQLEGIAQDRGDWRVIVGGLCSGRSKGPK